jgi:uncharacterized protein (DUF1778 family)
VDLLSRADRILRQHERSDTINPRASRRQKDLIDRAAEALGRSRSVLRTLQVAETAGVRAILVHCISDRARRFYVKYEFIESPLDPMTVMMITAQAARMPGRSE